MEKESHIPAKKLIFAIAGIVLCAILCFVPAPAALDAAASAANSTGILAMRILGITVLAICWWISEIIPDWLTAIAMLLLWILLGEVPFSAAFSSFSSTSVWLIFGAFCLATGVTKTGLFKRISWFLIRLFSPTFSGQVLALLLVGAVCAPLVPSATAKAVLGASIAKNIADAMGYPADSKSRCGLFIASFIGFAASTPAFMSGSVFTYAMLGTLSEAGRANINWTSWMVAMLPWLAILLVSFFFIIRIRSPKSEGGLMTAEYVKQEYAKLGAFSKQERIASVLLGGAVLLWVLESALSINAAVTAMAAAFLCFALGILDQKDLATAVPWGLIIFLGGVLNLGSILARVGLDVWIQSLLSPLFSGISNPFVLVFIVAITVIVLRLVMVSQAATVILMMAIVAPVIGNSGLTPFAVGIVILVVEQCWFLSFQNVVFTPALSGMQGTVKHNDTVMYCVLFEIVSIVALFACIPYWKLLGI